MILLKAIDISVAPISASEPGPRLPRPDHAHAQPLRHDAARPARRLGRQVRVARQKELQEGKKERKEEHRRNNGFCLSSPSFSLKVCGGGGKDVGEEMESV